MQGENMKVGDTTRMNHMANATLVIKTRHNSKNNWWHGHTKEST
uniref:Uncharacterized protein n=1 Tax=Arundo donax TaxID=35708 RepID=A0A0A9FJ27_ARUDO